MVGLARKLFMAVLATFVVGAEGKLTAPADAEVALPKPDAEGFITIFNGKDLTGWEGLQEYWSVKDGAISGHETEDASKQTFLVFTRLKMSDFELRLKYKFATLSGNSGVQFRSRVLNPRTWVVGGYQADLDAGGGLDGSIYDEAGVAGNRGAMSRQGRKTIWDAENERHEEPLGESAGELKQAVKIGEWNDLALTAKGNHVVYAINGHVMTELIDGSPNALMDGVLALQLHGGFTMEVLFKDVRVRLPSEKTAD